MCRKPYDGYICLLYGLRRIREQMKPEGREACVRVVCNSCLNPLDVHTARAAKWEMHREWCTSLLQGSGEGGSEVPDESTGITRLK